jgi:hypothetical protein
MNARASFGFLRRTVATLLSRASVLAVLLAAVTGCSNFGREWKAAARQPAPTAGIGGRWEGTWVSEANGHSGRLRAILTPESEASYRTRFRARYAGILSFGYTVTLLTTNDAGVVRFGGQADLGKFAGGVYTYAGYATPTNFFSTYKSKGDHGRFEMRRPAK